MQVMSDELHTPQKATNDRIMNRSSHALVYKLAKTHSQTAGSGVSAAGAGKTGTGNGPDMTMTTKLASKDNSQV